MSAEKTRLTSDRKEQPVMAAVESRTFYPGGKIHARHLSNGNTEYLDKDGKVYALKFPDQSMEYYDKTGMLTHRMSSDGKKTIVPKTESKKRTPIFLVPASSLEDTMTGIDRKKIKQEKDRREKKEELIKEWKEDLFTKLTTAELTEINRRIKIAKDEETREYFEAKKKLLQEEPREYFNKEAEEAKNRKDERARALKKVAGGLNYIYSDESKVSSTEGSRSSVEIIKYKKPKAETPSPVNVAEKKPRMVDKIFGKLEATREARTKALGEFYRAGVEMASKQWSRWGRGTKAVIFGALLLGPGVAYLGDQSKKHGIGKGEHTNIESSEKLVKAVRAKKQYDINQEKAVGREQEEQAQALRKNIETQEGITRASDLAAQEKLQKYLREQKEQRARTKEGASRLQVKDYMEVRDAANPTGEKTYEEVSVTADNPEAFIQKGDTGAFPTSEPAEATPDYLKKDRISPTPTPVEVIKADLEQQYRAQEVTEKKEQPAPEVAPQIKASKEEFKKHVCGDDMKRWEDFEKMQISQVLFHDEKDIADPAFKRLHNELWKMNGGKRPELGDHTTVDQFLNKFYGKKKPGGKISEWGEKIKNWWNRNV